MDTNAKLNFLKVTFPTLVLHANPDRPNSWGKMNLQQMVEHMSEAVKNASGKLKLTQVTPPEKIPAMHAFVISDREFKPNTKNVLMAEEPLPTKHDSINSALQEFQSELNYFENFFTENPGSTQLNPFFGILDFDEWCHLLHKHAKHHLKQFTLIE